MEPGQEDQARDAESGLVMSAGANAGFGIRAAGGDEFAFAWQLGAVA
jgi:hypothetical protein